MSQGECRVVMAVVPPAAAMRHHESGKRRPATGPPGATVWVESPKQCGVAGASVGYQIPAVSGGSAPIAILTSSNPTSAARAGAASRANRVMITATSLTAVSFVVVAQIVRY